MASFMWLVLYIIELESYKTSHQYERILLFGIFFLSWNAQIVAYFLNMNIDSAIPN